MDFLPNRNKKEVGDRMSKYKNVGKELKPKDTLIDSKGTKNPRNLMRYEDKSKRRSKTNLTKGAFG